jgi:hypothetical protein
VKHGGHGDILHKTFEDIKDKYHRHGEKNKKNTTES